MKFLRRSTVSKMLNNLLILTVILLAITSIKQIGVFAATILVLFLCIWLVIYNYVWKSSRVTNTKNNSHEYNEK